MNNDTQTPSSSTPQPTSQPIKVLVAFNPKRCDECDHKDSLCGDCALDAGRDGPF